AGEEIAALGLNALIDRRIVHEQQGLRYAALDLVGLEGRIEAELLLELSLQPAGASERILGARGRRRTAQPAEDIDQRVPQSVGPQPRRVSGGKVQVLVGGVAQADLPLVRLAVHDVTEHLLDVVVRAAK